MRRLRAAGMLRRNDASDDAELRVLPPTAAAKLACPDCQATGLRAETIETHDEDEWPQASTCTTCGALIAAERVEIFPDAKLCVACQGKEDRDESREEPEFCPRCGSLMVVRQTRGAGLTCYALICSDYPRCRGKA